MFVAKAVEGGEKDWWDRPGFVIIVRESVV